MSDLELRESLVELRAELDRLEAEEAEVRARLDALAAGIETKLDTPDDAEDDDSLIEEVRDSVLELEVSHPKATAILNRIMAALGNLG